MSAKITFLAKTAARTDAPITPLLTVPSSAVVERHGTSVVFLVRDGVAAEVPVRIGVTIGDRVVIEEGLVQGDEVILRPDPSITAGTKVKKRP
jgi:multidrug efflux pump subunit AcrA (membrane-fusion protein)